VATVGGIEIDVRANDASVWALLPFAMAISSSAVSALNCNRKAAVILFDGEGSVLKLTGEAVLVNQGGTWRVDDELTDVVMK
jgi:hypothetical protein